MAKKLTALQIANKIEEVRTRMRADKAIDTALTLDFKEALKRENRTFAGNYKVTTSTGFKVAVEELALPFALQRGLVKIDTAKAHKIFNMDASLRFADPMQYGFEVTTTMKIDPIKKVKDEE